MWANLGVSGQSATQGGAAADLGVARGEHWRHPSPAHARSLPWGDTGSQQDGGLWGSPGCPEQRAGRLRPPTREVLAVTRLCGLGFRAPGSRCSTSVRSRRGRADPAPGTITPASSRVHGLGEGSPSCPRLASGEATSTRPVGDPCGTKGPSKEMHLKHGDSVQKIKSGREHNHGVYGGTSNTHC